ncbi:MAG: hypothetical protein K2L18_01470, partial [Acetatifactor sp.]|nr:hypothetical protein [Acetatifactor sp.]
MGKMSKEDLFREIGEIDETYVEEARRARRRRRSASRAGKALVAAASLVLCVGVGYMALLVMQPHGSAGGAMSGAPSANGSAADTGQEQYSMMEGAAGQMAGGAMTEAEAQEVQGDASGKEMNQSIAAEQGDQEAAPEEAPAQEYEDQKISSNAESERGQQDGMAQEPEAKEETSTIRDTAYPMEESFQVTGGAVELTWEAARADASYGRYVDVQVPEGYSFTSGSRTTLAMHLIWNKGMEEISITCRQADEDVSDWLVDVEKPEEYDLGLYTIPWSDSVPPELIQQVSNAAFRPDQIT